MAFPSFYLSKFSPAPQLSQPLTFPGSAAYFKTFWNPCMLISGLLHWAMPHVIFLATAQQNDKTGGRKFKNYPGSFIELKNMLRMGHSLFLTFLRSLGGSFRALMISDEALGTTDTLACLFWIVNWTVIRSPFQSCVALAMSSPTFLGDWNVYDLIFVSHKFKYHRVYIFLSFDYYFTCY